MDTIEEVQHQTILQLRNALNALRKDAGKRNKDELQDDQQLRSAFFILTRILLVRLWEDYGLVEKRSNEFNHYGEMNSIFERILTEYFGMVNNDRKIRLKEEEFALFYSPDRQVLNSVYHQLSELDCKKIDFDVLGVLYQESIDHQDRKNRGQYYTPQEIISFILDRVGLKRTSNFFYDFNGQLCPKLISDPASGSGGFLMEAAFRLSGDARGDCSDPQRFVKARDAFSSLHGSEIEAFSGYITRVNLLIQLTPVIRKLIDTGCTPVNDLSLSIINSDSLGSFNHNLYYDYVCSNPPFIGEKGNKDLFRSTLDKYPQWKKYYQGKMDYSYWFVILGLSRLRIGGKLGFVTTAYWPTANGASKLRRFILDHAVIKELVYFSNLSVFGAAPGQHNMIMILERSDDAARRTKNIIKIARLKKLLKNSKQSLYHLEKHIDKASYSDEYIEVFNSAMIQGHLSHTAWNLFHSHRGHKTVNKIAAKGVPLGNLCRINQGIISGADKVTEKNIKLLSDSWIAKHRIRIDDGIFVLNEKELRSLSLSNLEMTIIKPFCKNSDINRYKADTNAHQFLIYVTRETDINLLPQIKSHLDKFRPILENKREYQEGKLPWFSLHWPRNEDIFESGKIITPNRAIRNSFAYSSIPLYAMSDVFFITEREQKEDLRYILAILNSSLMEFWFSQTQKNKGQMREYVGTPLSSVPIYQIDFSNRSQRDAHDRLVSLSQEMMNLSPVQAASCQKEIDAQILQLYSLRSSEILL